MKKILIPTLIMSVMAAAIILSQCNLMVAPADFKGPFPPPSPTPTFRPIPSLTPTPTYDPADNILTNGDFSYVDNGSTPPWYNWVNTGIGTSASFSIVGGALYVDIIDGKDTGWYIQQIYPNIDYLTNKRYILRFDAWAAGNRTISLDLQENGIDNNGDLNFWTSYGGATVNLTTSPATFTVIMDMLYPSDPAGRLVFNLGANNTDVWIDNVSITETNP
jgi:hypothetical protein